MGQLRNLCIASNGNTYHRECFSCDVCSTQLVGKKYAILQTKNETQQLCEKCTHKHNEQQMKLIEEENSNNNANIPFNLNNLGNSARSLVNSLKNFQKQPKKKKKRICSNCDKIIPGRAVQTPGGQLFHLDCFVCSDCKCRLAGKAYGLLHVGNDKKRLCKDCIDNHSKKKN